MPNKNSPLRDWLTAQRLLIRGILCCFLLAPTVLNISQIIFAQHTFPELVTLLDILAGTLFLSGVVLIFCSRDIPIVTRRRINFDRTGDHQTPPITPSKNKST